MEVNKMSVFTVNNTNFAEIVLKSEKPVLLDFWASWCLPCRMMMPVVEKLAKTHPEITVCKVNIDEAPELAQQFQVTVIPTFVLFKNGRLVDSSMGLKSKKTLERMIQQK
jgi:thioredoxin 1